AENLTLVYSRLEQWSKVSHYAKLARSLRPEPAEIVPKPVAEEQLAFTADNQHLVYLSRFGLAQIWRLPAGEQIQTIHTGPYEHAALSLDGTLVATVANNNIRIWQTLTGKLVSAFEVEGRIAGLAIRPDNQLLLTFHYLEILPKYTNKGLFPFVRFWDLASGQQTGEIELPPPGFCGLSPRFVDAEWQAVVIGLIYESPYGYDRVRLHICPLKTEPPYFDGGPGHKQRFQDANITAVATVAGGNQVALAISVAGNSHLRQQAEQRCQLWRLGHHYPLNPVNIVKTMAATAIGLPLGLLLEGRRWLTASRSTETRPQKPFLEQVGGRLEETISGFPTFNKQAEFASSPAHSRWLRLTPDAAVLISGNQDGTIQLRRLPDGFQLKSLQQHEWAVTLGSLHPDGNRLATADETGQLIFWEIPAGSCLHVTQFPLPLTKLATSPDGARLACSRQDGQITIFAWANPQAEPRVFNPPDDF
ncbi:MAG: hypothetical protein KDE59_20680, partial [Anaerolineales bacterium]|nr:hypothetical protein [Anaerolineales bacterium]